MSLAESDTHHGIEHAWVTTKGPDCFNELIGVRVYMTILHLLEQRFERLFIPRYVLPIDSFLEVDYAADRPDPGLDDHEKATTTMAHALRPFKVL